MTQTAHFPPGNYAILFPLPLMVVLANGGITLGFTAYWLSLRQFYNDPPLRLMVLPAITGMLVLLWYSTVTPHTAYRVAISSVVWTIIFGGCLHTLLKQGHRDSGHGRQVLIAVFALLLAFVWIRMGYLTLVARVAPDYSISTNSWIDLLTPMLVATLPVVGTTVFVLMCSERLRRAVETHPFRTGRLNLPPTVSIGIALQEPGERDFNTLLKRADKAMYMAKNDGRNRVVVADNRGTNDTQ